MNGVATRWRRSHVSRPDPVPPLDLLEATAEFFALTLAQAHTTIKEVARVTATWRDTSKAVGARAAEINRMASALEHDDLKRARVL